MPRPALGPVAQALDGLAHARGQGDGVGQHLAEIQLGGFAVLGEGAVQGLDEGGLDLRTGVQFAGPGQGDGVVGGRLAAELADHDVPDRGALPGALLAEPDRLLKLFRMFWTETAAEDILGLRSLVLAPPHFDAAWTKRRRLLAQQGAKARRWSLDLETRAA